jgi:glycerol-3-phosphate O-acyltransferase
VTHYVVWNVGRLLTRRWKRYGRAAVTIGAPIGLASWYESQPDLYELPRHERLARVQSLTDGIMDRIGQLIPVTPVPLVCAAVQSLGGDALPHARLVERIADLRDALLEINAHVLRADRDAEETLAVAMRMLAMRRVLVRDGAQYVVLPHGRELVSYYANSVAHLLGPYESAVRARDALPVDSLVV